MRLSFNIPSDIHYTYVTLLKHPSMTTILWEPTSRTLFADSMTTNRRTKYATVTATKIVLLPASSPVHWSTNTARTSVEYIRAIAGCGVVPVLDFLTEMTIRHGRKVRAVINELPYLHEIMVSGISAEILVLTDKRIHRLVMRTQASPCLYSERNLRDRITMGSGAGYVEAAIKTYGFNAVDALRYARLHDPSTGGRILSCVLKSDGTASHGEVYPDASTEEDFNHVQSLISKQPSKLVNEIPTFPFYGDEGRLKHASETAAKPRIKVPIHSVL